MKSSTSSALAQWPFVMVSPNRCQVMLIYLGWYLIVYHFLLYSCMRLKTPWDNKLLLLALVLIFLIATLQATFLFFFFLLVGMDVSASCNSSSTPNPCYLGSTTRFEVEITRGIGFVLYRIDRLIIAISSTLLSKSIETSSRTQTFFSYKLHQHWFRILMDNKPWNIHIDLRLARTYQT